MNKKHITKMDIVLGVWKVSIVIFILLVIGIIGNMELEMLLNG